MPRNNNQRLPREQRGMNGYIRLFYELSKLHPSQMVDKSVAEKIGFFLTDLELLDKERYIFLEESISGKRKKYNIKLAPKGFSSLENYMRDKKESERGRLTRDTTIVLTLVAILGISLNLYEKYGHLLEKIKYVPALLSFLTGAVIVAFILLFILKTINIIFSKESWKGLIFNDH